MTTATAIRKRPMLKAALVLLAFTLVLTTGCNAVGSLFGGGGGGGGGRALWSDVPKMDGMQGADLGLPLAARLGIQAAFQGNIDYLSFTTDATTADVQAFYSTERMTQAGLECSGAGLRGRPAGRRRDLLLHEGQGRQTGRTGHRAWPPARTAGRRRSSSSAST